MGELMNYGQRFLTSYRRQGARPCLRKGNAKSKMAARGGLTNSCEKKKSKSKGEKERYTRLSTEFQRITRRGKKAFLSDQCKEIEENNRMGKTRDFFKKIRDTQGIFHAKVGSIKGRNGKIINCLLLLSVVAKL